MDTKRIGRYRIVGKVGSGGVGEVFRAFDNRLDRVVALKFLHERLLRHRRSRERFRREGLIAATLNHPNVCTIYDVDECAGRPFIVMEFLDGQPLSECIRTDSLDLDSVMDIVAQLGRALCAAHECDVIHRDVKPANAFVLGSGIAKLLDFGVAKSADLMVPVTPDQDTDPGTDTSQGLLAGTICYMSPEQARGDVVDGRSDLFSLGVLLYEAVTGVHPFVASSPALVFDRIFHQRPDSPLRANPALPLGLVRLIERSLCKRRGSRYQTAGEMVADLEQVRCDWRHEAEFEPARRVAGEQRLRVQ